MNFGGEVFDPENFEKELFSKMNRIEIRKVDDPFDPLKMMEQNLGDISCIQRNG